jgi:hypothetical protein
MADADLNPVRYLATLIGAGMVSIILDPAAVLSAAGPPRYR